MELVNGLGNPSLPLLAVSSVGTSASCLLLHKLTSPAWPALLTLCLQT